MPQQITLDTIRNALTLAQFDAVTAQRKMSPLPRGAGIIPRIRQPRLGAVLALLFQKETTLYLLLTKRREDLNSHAGQISFPGGKHEEAESFVDTALRETHEEVGILPTAVTILGQLTPLFIPPSGFEVHPFVGWYRNGPAPTFTPNVYEVSELIETPLTHLLDPNTRQEEIWKLRGFPVNVPFFQVGEHKVWGATAMMLSELIERLRQAENNH